MIINLSIGLYESKHESYHIPARISQAQLRCWIGMGGFDCDFRSVRNSAVNFG